MKVGVLTFHDGINYGSFFQVYALQSFLLQHGFQCQVINYKNPGFTLREYTCFLDPRRLPIQRIIENIIKIARFKMAHRKLNLTNRIFKAAKLTTMPFDVILIGSDEVWNVESTLIGCDPVYFSYGLKADRIMSYAASFGNVKTHEALPTKLKDSLRERIDPISVRDQNSADIMGKISEKPARIVLDPSFLVDLKSEAIRPRDQDFILIYGFFSTKMIRRILEYARFVGKKTVSVSYDCSWCDISLNTLSPFQWLGYFASCDRVITTMYHGMIFSLLYQKEFCVLSTPYRKNKFGNFLSDLGLSNRIADEDSPMKSVFTKKIDYAKVNAQIETKRYHSKNFLLKIVRQNESKN